MKKQASCVSSESRARAPAFGESGPDSGRFLQLHSRLAAGGLLDRYRQAGHRGDRGNGPERRQKVQLPHHRQSVESISDVPVNMAATEDKSPNSFEMISCPRNELANPHDRRAGRTGFEVEWRGRRDSNSRPPA